jgi:hypothetical protein
MCPSGRGLEVAVKCLSGRLLVIPKNVMLFLVDVLSRTEVECFLRGWL